MKQIMVQEDNFGRIELFKLNRKGFYNFIRYIQEQEISKLKKEFKGHNLVNKLKGA
jgi:hypothetical protein